MDRLQVFTAGRRSSKDACGDPQCFEREWYEYRATVERALMAEEAARLVVDRPGVTIEGHVYRQCC